MLDNSIYLKIHYHLNYFFSRIFGKNSLDADVDAKAKTAREVEKLIHNQTDRIVKKICQNC